MKKGLRTLSILNILVGILAVVMLVLSVVKPAGFGEFLLKTYEDITNNMGHTVAGLYSKLIEICSYALCVVAVLGLLFFILDEVCYKINCFEDENCEECGAPVDDDGHYRTRIQFGRDHKADEKRRQERKAKKDAKRAEKEASKQSKQEEPVETPAPQQKQAPVMPTSGNSSETSKEAKRQAILDQLRNRKR